MRKIEFPFNGKIIGKCKHSKVMDFSSIWGEIEIYTNRKDMEQNDFHITEKVWEYKKHYGFSKYSGENKKTCNLKIMGNINCRVMRKRWESSNYFQMMDSLRYFRLNRKVYKHFHIGYANSYLKKCVKTQKFKI